MTRQNDAYINRISTMLDILTTWAESLSGQAVDYITSSDDDLYAEGLLRLYAPARAFSRLAVQCESPIEVKLLACMMGTEHELGVIGLPSGDPAVQIEIEPQANIGPYRVDFLISIRAGSVGNSYIVVECDGHDFHERTKEQAKRDKSRDRYLTKLGCKVLRFTGSEIHNNGFQCAEEVVELVADIAVAYVNKHLELAKGAE